METPDWFGTQTERAAKRRPSRMRPIIRVQEAPGPVSRKNRAPSPWAASTVRAKSSVESACAVTASAAEARSGS